MWNRIPLDADIVITHTPPKYHCDERSDRRAVGCEALRERLWRVRPRLAVCGHVHEGRGVERIRWDLGVSNIKYKESGVERWEDPGKYNKKMSLMDLTGKGRKPLDNDGSMGTYTSESSDIRVPQYPTVNNGSVLDLGTSKPKPNATAGISRVTANLLAVPPESLPPANLGQGGIPPSQRCDLEALSGRMGRRETCLVNAAIVASSWPHTNGRKFHKPIVVDLELPVWEK